MGAPDNDLPTVLSPQTVAALRKEAHLVGIDCSGCGNGLDTDEIDAWADELAHDEVVPPSCGRCCRHCDGLGVIVGDDRQDCPRCEGRGQTHKPQCDLCDAYIVAGAQYAWSGEVNRVGDATLCPRCAGEDEA